jgi:DNA-binding PadR family transcriptional regulator
MQAQFEYPSHPPMIRLLNVAADQFAQELGRRITAAGFGDIRPGHGCVFGNIDPEHGSRLTEVTSDLEERGYLERVADPSDGRAKIIRLTDQGREAYAIGRQLIDELEREWADRYGAERVAGLREALEAVTAERLGALPA